VRLPSCRIDSTPENSSSQLQIRKKFRWRGATWPQPIKSLHFGRHLTPLQIVFQIILQDPKHVLWCHWHGLAPIHVSPSNKALSSSRMICIVLNGHIKTVMSYTFKLYSKMFGFKLWCSQALIYSGITSGSCLCSYSWPLGANSTC